MRETVQEVTRIIEEIYKPAAGWKPEQEGEIVILKKQIFYSRHKQSTRHLIFLIPTQHT